MVMSCAKDNWRQQYSGNESREITPALLEILKDPDKKINKDEQTSDWGTKKITSAQQRYAATDVLYLHELRIKLNEILKREKRTEMAQACFNFIEHRVKLDLSGWPDLDIFKH